MTLTLQPSEVARRRELLLIDIRPIPERHSILGFIPTSLALPLAGDVAGALAQLEALHHRTGFVLCCTSGRRSAQACGVLAEHAEFPLFHLEGGQLAWEAAGLPMCQFREEPADFPADPVMFRRYFVSCFVAENTEIALDHQLSQTDPYRMLQACFREAKVSWDHPTIEGLYRVLDIAAVAAHQAGGDLAHIADNLGTMHAILRAIERASG
jgi:rhodanese-related sulfurtransferase